VLVASLIVAIATLAWIVYTDLRSKTPELSPEAVVRRVRIALPEHGGSNQPDADRITEIVVNEIISPAGEPLPVSDGAAREFARELYGRLQAGSSLRDAVKSAREAVARQPDDPTWLAYTVYGDPRATLSQQRP
jgi:hypothetical protein